MQCDKNDKCQIRGYIDLNVPGPQTKRHPEKGGKLNTSQAESVAASRAAVGQFLSISREDPVKCNQLVPIMLI